MYITDKQLLNKDDLYQDESFFEYYGVIKFSREWSNPKKPKGFTLDIITLLASEYLLNTGPHQPLNWKFVVCLQVKFMATFESNMNLTYMYFTFQCQLECLEKCLSKQSESVVKYLTSFLVWKYTQNIFLYYLRSVDYQQITHQIYRNFSAIKDYWIKKNFINVSFKIWVFS